MVLSKYCVILVLIILICTGCSAKGGTHHSDTASPATQTQSVVSANSNRHLQISAESIDNFLVSAFDPDELGIELSRPLVYRGLKNVTVNINDSTYKLEDAFKSGIITFSQIFADAQMDADAGICIKRWSSVNGLTTFLYKYPEFDLEIVYDVYETPDGNSHLIQDMAFSRPGCTVPHYYTDKNGNLIDREDWGISFSVTNITPSGLTLCIAQSAGQQVGDLSVVQYEIFPVDSNAEGMLEDSGAPIELYSGSIQSESITDIPINWTNSYGALPNGQYTLRLEIMDTYTKEHSNPLERNFYDQQVYRIPFSIS